MILLGACLVVIVPLGYLIINSIKLPREFLTVPPTILPSEVTFQHYQELLDDSKTVRFFRNSLTVAFWTTAITIVSGTLAAYGLARMRLAARVLALVTFIFLFIRFYPRVTTVIPFFLVMRQFDLLDTVWAIIIGHLGITIPFVTWLMLVVFQDLPKELEEAALVDGASVWQRFWRVVLPIVMPSVSAAAILTAFLSWNEFLIASSVARRKASVLSIAGRQFRQRQRHPVGTDGGDECGDDRADDCLRPFRAEVSDSRHHLWRRQGLAAGACARARQRVSSVMVKPRRATLDRATAYDIVCEFVQSDSLRKHMLAVEFAMRAYARHYDEDADSWGLVGLLHDFDWEVHPSLEQHPMHGAPILRERGLGEEDIRTILSHGRWLPTTASPCATKRSTRLTN